MANSESLNSAEYVYDINSEGKFLFLRLMTVSLYALFILSYFLFCYITRIITLFAIAPMLLYIIILFTWRLVKYDVYWSFERGTLEIGKVTKKRGITGRKKITEIHVKDAFEISPYVSKKQLSDIKSVYDISGSPKSQNRIIIIFSENGKRACAIIEATARLAQLLSAFSGNAHDIKGKKFHG